MLASKDFTAAKNVISSGIQPDDHWIKSNAYPTELAWPVLCKSETCGIAINGNNFVLIAKNSNIRTGIAFFVPRLN